MVPGAWCLVLGAVRGAGCRVPGAVLGASCCWPDGWQPEPAATADTASCTRHSTQHPAPSTLHSTKHQALSTTHPSHFHQLSNGTDNQFRLVELHPVAASRRDDVTATGRTGCQGALGSHLFQRLVAAGNNDHRKIGRRNRGVNRRAISLESPQVIGHRVKTLRLAPERLNNRMNLRWKLPHFSNQPFECSRCRRTEDFHKPSGHAWCTAGQERQTGTDDSKMRQYGSQLR